MTLKTLNAKRLKKTLPPPVGSKNTIIVKNVNIIFGRTNVIIRCSGLRFITIVYVAVANGLFEPGYSIGAVVFSIDIKIHSELAKKISIKYLLKFK